MYFCLTGTIGYIVPSFLGLGEKKLIRGKGKGRKIAYKISARPAAIAYVVKKMNITGIGGIIELYNPWKRKG